MIRSHHSLPWRCCGVVHPAEYRHCPWCGSSVVSVDRVLVRCPLPNGGDLIVAANAQPDAEGWEFLAEIVEVTKGAFKSRKAKDATTEPNKPSESETRTENPTPLANSTAPLSVSGSPKD